MAPSFCIDLARHEQSRLLGIARASIASGFATGRPLEPEPEDLTGVLAERLGSFVTLMQSKALRGCVGSLIGNHPLAQGVGVAAFNAAFRDSRFTPLAAAELDRTHIEISVLSPPEPLPASSNAELLAALRPGHDGLLLVDAGRRATFLPKVWETLPDAGQFVRRLKAKAGLSESHWSESIRFFRYDTVTIAERSAP
jgi:AmmeMemoRadiSam system protein A